MIILHHFSLFLELHNMKELSIDSSIGTFFFVFGKLGVNIFILISGYFLINSKFKATRIIKLWLQIVFYSVLIMAILKFANIISVSWKELYKYFLPISYHKYWFISTYMYLYLLSPFINKFAKSLKQNDYKTLLIILTVLFSIIYSIIYDSNKYITGTGIFESISWFVYLYLLAGYIRLYGIKLLQDKKKNIIIACLALILFLVVIFGSRYIFIEFGKLGNLLKYFTRMNSIFLLILAVTIFYIFKNMKERHSKVVNYFGHLTIAVYLIHEHPNLRMIIWNNVEKIMNHLNMHVILMAILSTIALFVFAAICEFVREYMLEKNILKLLKNNKLLEKIDLKMDIN